MQEGPLLAFTRLFDLELVVLGAALLYVLARQRHLASTVGRSALRGKAPGSRRARALRAAPPAVAMLVLFAHATATGAGDAEYATLMPAFEALALAALVAWCSPREGEVVAGEDGLQLGWDAWSWNALAATNARLEGAELVFGADGARVRCRLGPEALARVRVALDPRRPGDD